MTTNKPEVVGFISEVGIKKLREDEHTSDWTLYAGPVRNSVTPLIRLSDYEALQAESELLRAAIRRLCNIYVVDDYYDGQLREERLEAAVNRAIDAVKEPPK